MLSQNYAVARQSNKTRMKTLAKSDKTKFGKDKGVKLGAVKHMIFSEEGVFRARAKIRHGLLYKAFPDSGSVYLVCCTRRSLTVAVYILYAVQGVP